MSLQDDHRGLQDQDRFVRILDRGDSGEEWKTRRLRLGERIVGQLVSMYTSTCCLSIDEVRKYQNRARRWDNLCEGDCHYRLYERVELREKCLKTVLVQGLNPELLRGELAHSRGAEILVERRDDGVAVTFLAAVRGNP